MGAGEVWSVAVAGSVRAVINDNDCAAKGGMWVHSPGIVSSAAACVVIPRSAINIQARDALRQVSGPGPVKQ